MKKTNKRNWKRIAIALLIVTIIDFLIPDPIPVVDEIILICLDVWAFGKASK